LPWKRTWITCDGRPATFNVRISVISLFDWRWLMSAAAIMSLLALGAARPAPAASAAAAVVLGPRASELERFAARELCVYLERLFGVRVTPADHVPRAADTVFLIGSPETNPAVRRACAKKPFPKVSDQGVVLQRQQLGKRLALVVGGGSPRATLWAVYELAERWGARYLLHGDVLPGSPGKLRLPEADVVLEPALRVRQWRVVNDFAIGPESWGMADYRPVLDQLAKLRFNRILINTYAWQPFLDLQHAGIRRREASLWYRYRYPVTDDMVGRELFGSAREFWNPDLPSHGSYEELAAAGERLIRSLIDHAHERGMECVLTATLTEYPPEFATLLKGAQKVRQLGEMTVVPSPETAPEDPALTGLAAAVLRATVNTYPAADLIQIGMPEFRQWTGLYEPAWKVLDRKYGLEAVHPLERVLAAARARSDYPGGAERALQEAKGDIVALYFYDRLLNELKVLKDSRRPDARLVYYHVAEELFPILDRILPKGAETLNGIDYTPSRILRRRHVLKSLPSRGTPAVLVYTLHDDNIGVLPQLMTSSLHELTKDLRQHGWAGFSTRYWLIGDHDPCVAYLSRAAWDAGATPESVYRDQIRAACGEASVDDLLAAFRELDATTLRLEQHGLGLTFPVPGMILKHYNPGPLPAELAETRLGYGRALEAARRALAKAAPGRQAYADYWVGRLEFGAGYLDAVELVRRAATADSESKAKEARQHTEAALETARRAIDCYARVARDQSDRGAIAVLNEYVYRPLKAKSAELQARAASGGQR
jgi:hypothetical protein